MGVFSLTVTPFIRNYITGRNHFQVRGTENRLEITRSFLKKTRISIIGNNNKITFGEKCRLNNTVITIRGNDNRVHLGNNVFIENGVLWIENDNGGILIGDGTAICGPLTT